MNKVYLMIMVITTIVIIILFMTYNKSYVYPTSLSRVNEINHMFYGTICV